MKNLGIEPKRFLFYIICVGAILISDKLSPSGPCTPGLGFFLFILLIPISLLLFIRDLYKYIKEPEKWRLNAVLTSIVVWLIIYLLIYFRVF